MIGEVSGLLTVIRQDGRWAGAKTRWFCECACGTTTVVRGDHLRSRAIRSCGCLRGGVSRPQLLQMEGQVFGRLTVVQREGDLNGYLTQWRCVCECGNTASVRGDYLRQGDVQSCGCSRLCVVAPDISTLAAGIAAEHLVTADLLLAGYRAFMTDQNCPYDVAVDIGRLIRIQVKSTRMPRLPGPRCRTVGYSFNVGRGGDRAAYAEGAFELFALVALDIRLIAYLLPSMVRQVVFVRVPGSVTTAGKQFGDFSFSKAVAALGCRR